MIGLMRLIDNNRVTYGTRLSARIWEDSNGQLICRDAIIARTGSYDYLESEIKEGGDRNKIVKVFRTEDEVFNPTSIASFENKPFVDDHPQEDVSLENFRELSKGYMRDVRRGTGDCSNCLICDIVVTDPETIEEIKSGRKRELSLGYDTRIIEKDGKYYMTNIRGNHLALVDSGRAGCATIRDSAEKISKTGGKKMRKSKVTLFDDDIYEVEEIQEDNDEVLENVPVAEEVKDDEPTLAQIYQLLLEIKESLAKPVVDDDETEETVPETAPVAAEEKVEAAAVEEKTEDCDKLTTDDDEEVEKEEEEIAGDEDELLDADELLTEPEEIKTKDAKSVYSKFSKVTDTRSQTIKSEIQKSFQDRYNRSAKKSY